MKTPKFWYSKNSIISILLRPISFLWVLGSILRKKKSYNFNNIKIIKVGNVVAGGSGKTPTVISIVKKLANSKYQVHIISRGYKGSIKKSTLVNTDIHSYKEVGDESIILSKIAPTWIGNNRIESIKNAQKMGAKIVVLDDGIQDTSIKGDLNLLVFNGLQGLGNGKIIPSGPLREKLSDSIKKCHLSIIIDEDINNIENKLNNLLPIIKAKINIESDQEELEKLSNMLWEKYSYEENEKDRVVLNVSLKASKNNACIFDRSFLMDAWGNENSTAMARLVSIPVALAVESVLNEKIPYGVTAAPKSPPIVTSWLDAIKKEAQIFNFIDNLS